ncbi:MAG: fuculose phosphate aldolase [Dehalococcoidia bacterium]|nr:fuculose phosphate aldolase [Dehalococcoidia bacterium]
MTPPHPRSGLDWNSLLEAGRERAGGELVSSHGGNLSLRRAGGGALVTTTGAMLGRLSPERLVAVGAQGRSEEAGAPAPSSDTAIHLAVYAAHAQAGAIVHVHPVHAIARSLAEGADAIEPANLEGQLFLKRVPVLDVAWERSAEPVARALRDAPVVVVRGHGSYARGVDVWDALRVTSALEEAARILTLAGR